MRHLDLFSGIGGFAISAQWVWKDEYECIAFCEINRFCQKVLKKHWPDVPIYDDIRRLDGTQFKEIDLLSAGWPCQPASVAGKQRGTSDDRWLWPDTLRLIHEVHPTWCVLENVRGLLSLQQGVVFNTLCAELETEGYEIQPFVLPACGVNAPHRRERIWLVAHSSSGGCYPNTGGRPICDADGNSTGEIRDSQQQQGTFSTGADMADSKRFNGERPKRKGDYGRQSQMQVGDSSENVANANAEGLEGWGNGLGSERDCACQRTPWACCAAHEDERLSRCGVRRISHGASNRVHRLRSLGNSIVPQVAMQIFLAIQEAERINTRQT